jgi:hypothetical protein
MSVAKQPVHLERVLKQEPEASATESSWSVAEASGSWQKSQLQNLRFRFCEIRRLRFRLLLVRGFGVAGLTQPPAHGLPRWIRDSSKN